MPPEPMALGQCRMIEIVAGVVNHANFLHNPTRTEVSGCGERYDLIEPRISEPVGQHLPRTFGGVSVTPVLGCQPPADLHTWRKMCLERGNRKSDESGEWHDLRNLHGPEPKAMLLKMGLDPCSADIAFFTRQKGWKMLHYARIGIERGERRPIIGARASQEQSGGSEFLWSVQK